MDMGLELNDDIDDDEGGEGELDVRGDGGDPIFAEGHEEDDEGMEGAIMGGLGDKGGSEEIEAVEDDEEEEGLIVGDDDPGRRDIYDRVSRLWGMTLLTF